MFDREFVFGTQFGFDFLVGELNILFEGFVPLFDGFGWLAAALLVIRSNCFSDPVLERSNGIDLRVILLFQLLIHVESYSSRGLRR